MIFLGALAFASGWFSHKLIEIENLEAGNHEEQSILSMESIPQLISRIDENELENIKENTNQTHLNDDNEPAIDRIIGDTVLLWGTIETDFGEVAPGERIDLYSTTLNKHYTTTSNEQGEYLFASVVPGSDYRLNVSPKGMFKRYRKHDLKLLATQSILTIKLESMPVGLLRGNIINAQGLPVPEFELSIRSLAKTRWTVPIRSDIVGAFQIEEFPEGPVEISSMNGMVLYIRGHQFEVGNHEPLNLVVDEGPYRVSGRVIDSHGEPVPGATVVLSWSHALREARSVVMRRTITDRFGVFAIKGLGEGRHDLVLSDSATAGLRSTINVGENQNELILSLNSDKDSQISIH